MTKRTTTKKITNSIFCIVLTFCVAFSLSISSFMLTIISANTSFAAENDVSTQIPAYNINSSSASDNDLDASLSEDVNNLELLDNENAEDSENADNKSAVVNTLPDNDEKFWEDEGLVSQLSTNTHNPYNKQMRIVFDIGAEFANYDGDEFSEGIIVKANPGGIVDVPLLHPKDGYYFVGWCQGGVPEFPTWSPETYEMEVTDNDDNGRNMRIYALYSDKQGNGFCTCGAWKEGVYKDRLEEIKQANDQYISNLKTTNSDKLMAAVFVAIMVCIFIVFIIFLVKDLKCGDGNHYKALV